MNLDELRKEIDSIDENLVKLLSKRMDISAKVGKFKEANAMPVLNSKREKEVLEKVTDITGEPLDGYARMVYSAIFDVSRSYQQSLMSYKSSLDKDIAKALKETPDLFPNKAVVACQGIEGAYSSAAAEKLFGFPTIMYFNSFEGVFTAVEKGLCQYGILPIENSSYGSVGQVYDLMKNYNFHIVRSLKLHISHKLLAKKGTKLEDITEIISHDQALGQCDSFLRDLKDVKITMCENTALAAQIVAESPRSDIAAISSLDCAGLYDLSVIHEGIQTSENNYTRFICISKNLEIYPGAGKISLMLSIPHRPQALYHMIAKFASLGVNLTKLESRPIPGSDFEFMFYFDMDASVYSPEIVKLLCQLESEPELFVFLGSYSEVV